MGRKAALVLQIPQCEIIADDVKNIIRNDEKPDSNSKGPRFAKSKVARVENTIPYSKKPSDYISSVNRVMAQIYC